MRFILIAFFVSCYGFSANAMNLQVLKSKSNKTMAYVLSGALFSVTTEFETLNSKGGRTLPPIEMDNSTIIFFRSPGGNGHGPTWLLNWLNSQLARTGAKPTIYVFDTCSSSCVEFITGLNHLAQSGSINLVLSYWMGIGIHGSSYANTEISSEPDVDQMRRIQAKGASGKWLEDHKKLFTRPTLDYMERFGPAHPIFFNSGIVDIRFVKEGVTHLLKNILRSSRVTTLYHGLNAFGDEPQWLLDKRFLSTEVPVNI
jgi:hypothetical protein